MPYILTGVFLILVPVIAHLNAYWNPPTFSSTQTWDESLLVLTTADSIFSQDQLQSVTLPQPPAPQSRAEKQDLATLHYYQTLRTPQKMTEVFNEISIDNAAFGSTSLSFFARSDSHTHTQRALQYALDAAGPVIFQQKQRYDRVRPSLLDPTLQPIIDVPLHPAYPSGHATQAHLIARILAALDPKNEATYTQAAERITRNREIAGVHYPTDGEAGERLAQQLYVLLQSDPQFNTLMDSAHTEW